MNTYRRLFIFLSFFFLTGWPLSQAQAQKDLPKVIRSLTVKPQPYATPAVLPRKAPAVSISPQLGKLRLPASWAPKTDKTKRPAAGTLSLAELQSLSADLQPPAPIHFPNPQALELLLQTGAPLRELKQFGSLCDRPMTETVVLNLSIRLAQIPGTPNVGKEQYLYEKLILQPLAYLKKQPYVAVRESPVF